MTSARSLTVPGARIHYEARGTGPLLLLVGSPMGAAAFATLADALASDFTVVTHDPRGIARSRVDDPEQDSTPELRADDVAALIEALGAESAHVFGSSGGAITGLALAQRHPRRVRTLVAHEPPLIELLPDAAARRAATEENIAIFHREGLGAAWAAFMRNAGFDMDGCDAPAGPPGEPSEQDLADGARFFAHELRGTTRFVPDIYALRSARVVVGIGVGSTGLVTVKTSRALAERLGVEPVSFPGDHAGWLGGVEEFAAVLRSVLR